MRTQEGIGSAYSIITTTFRQGIRTWTAHPPTAGPVKVTDASGAPPEDGKAK
jgi:hypothetical protein